MYKGESLHCTDVFFLLYTIHVRTSLFVSEITSFGNDADI